MRASSRWTLALAIAVLVAGVVGVVVHHAPARHQASTVPTTTVHASPTTSHVTTATTAVPGPPGANSAALAANLLTPTDLGGFYSSQPDAAGALLSSAPCLAGLSPSDAQSGRATTAMIGPDSGAVPEIVEVVMSYPGSGAAGVYRSLVATLQVCPSFAMSLGGTRLQVPMGIGSLPSVGDRSSDYQGRFSLSGRTEQIGIALVLTGRNVFAIVFIDTVPQSNPIFGDLPSTVGAALGKEA